ncbi:hypothetical protein [Pseudomonas sp. UBA1879]|uniref:hypothetical protein n=1 Tax=Pseudomonas sp. UBA1879 TaxID=1947305 RepID=UPI0025DE96F5|nr:hypothetical protein [Pseudomonas sp. UBA1879]
MNDMNVKAPIPLPPAVVPVAFEDGLLKVADLDAPIAVEVEVWPAAETGYTVRLHLDNEPVTNERVITDDDKPGNMLTLHLAESLLLHDGTYNLQYRIYSPFADLEDFSPEVALKVDRTPPGGALLGPVLFAERELNSNTLAFIPGYAGIETGDLIRTLCNGVAGPTHTVQADELTLRPIEIVFEKAFLQSLGADYVNIDYTVTDRAGNESIRSLPKTLALVS